MLIWISRTSNNSCSSLTDKKDKSKNTQEEVGLKIVEMISRKTKAEASFFSGLLLANSITIKVSFLDSTLIVEQRVICLWM